MTYTNPEDRLSDPHAKASAALALIAAEAAHRSADSAEASAKAAAESRGPDLKSVVAATVGAMTSLLALFVGLGLTGERMATIFNGGAARTRLLAALLLAVVSIGLGLLSVALTQWRRWVAVLSSLTALVGSLVFGIYAASASFSDGGRPTLTKVSLTAEGDTQATLSFTVTATGVKHDSLLRAFALWIREDSSQVQEPPFYQTTLRPDDKGTVSQEVTVLLDRHPTERSIRLQIYWDTATDKVPTTTKPPGSASVSPSVAASTPPATTEVFGSRVPVGAQCGNQANASLAGACAEISIVGTVPSSAS